jgi:hypothetical protein
MVLKSLVKDEIDRPLSALSYIFDKACQKLFKKSKTQPQTLPYEAA